jgi:hypothetical protein
MSRAVLLLVLYKLALPFAASTVESTNRHAS